VTGPRETSTVPNSRPSFALTSLHPLKGRNSHQSRGGPDSPSRQSPGYRGGSAPPAVTLDSAGPPAGSGNADGISCHWTLFCRPAHVLRWLSEGGRLVRVTTGGTVMVERADIVVIGAGLGGLAAAVTAAGRERRVPGRIRAVLPPGPLPVRLQPPRVERAGARRWHGHRLPRAGHLGPSPPPSTRPAVRGSLPRP